MAEFETTFADLGLKAPILEALNDLGYEKPSPIQAECIPHLLNGATFWVWPRRGAENCSILFTSVAES